MSEKYAVVFGGGGAKGAYEIGVWKALKELNIEIEAVFGTSVGSLNAGLVAMGDFDRAMELWQNITLDGIVEIPKELLKDGKLNVTKENLKLLNTFQAEVMKNKGLDTAPLLKLLEQVIDEKKVRSSGIDFGIVTYQLNNLRPVEIYLEDINEGELVDYMLASSSLPGFKSTSINNKQFVDGGVHDNVPFNLAKQRGYKNIIVVDISGLGVSKEPQINGTRVTYIKNSEELGGIIEFVPEKIKRNIELGYLDAMKVFDRYKGFDYFYQEDDNAVINELEDLFYKEEIFNEYKVYFNNPDKIKYAKDTIKDEIRKFLPKDSRFLKKLSLSMMECAADSLKIEKVKGYKLTELLKLIKEEHQKISSKKEEFKGNFDHFFGKVISELNKFQEEKKTIFDLFGKSVSEYDMALNILLGGGNDNPGNAKKISVVYPAIIPAKIFLMLLSKLK